MKRVCCLFPGFILAVLTSCMALEDVRKLEPERVETVAGNYREVATCVAIAWSGHLGNNLDLIVDDRAQESRIVISTDETLFRQIDNDRVRVEHRRSPVLVPMDPPWMWSAVDACEQEG